MDGTDLARKLAQVRERIGTYQLVSDLIETCKEVIGGADNQGPVHPATIEKLEYIIERLESEPKYTSSKP